MTAPHTSAAHDYALEAKRIIALVKRDFVLPDGTLFLERTGSDILARHIFPDLGDMIPFFLYFGEDEFVEQQVHLYEAALEDGFLVSQFPALRLEGLVKSYEYTDLLLGLATLQELRPSKEHQALLDTTVEAARRAFRFDGKLRSFYHLRSRLALPIIDTRDATLIECFTTLYHQTHDTRYLTYAKRIYTTLIRTPFFERYGLFADYEPTHVFARLALARNPKTREAKLCKNSTNALFAFLELYRSTGDATILATIDTILSAVAAHATTPEGGIVERFIPGSLLGPACLTASFPILDFLCDFAAFVPERREQALTRARVLADFWLNEQGTTGLFPLYVGGKETFFDSETDMTVALTKLAELSGDARYARAADRCLEGILTYHKASDYPLAVDIQSGSVVNPTQRTKFLCLFLKLLILKIEEGKGKHIYDDAPLLELLKDR